MLRHTLTALAAAGVLLTGACSSGDDSGENAAAVHRASGATTSQRFCDSAEALYDQLESAGATDPSSPAVRSVFADARRLVAPDEIAGDWNEVLDALEPLVAGEIDMNDPADMETFTDRTAEAAGAFQRTGTYFEQECGLGSTTTSAPAPTDAPDPALDPAPGTDPSGAPTGAP